MAKKSKKYPGEKDESAFVRVASRAVREAREDNRGELGQPIALNVTVQERDTILAALRLWQCDSTHIADTDGSIADIATEHGDALTVKRVDKLCERINGGGSQKSSAILVTVSGGVADYVPETVPAGITVEIIDFDNLNDDPTFTLAQLSPVARRYAKANR